VKKFARSGTPRAYRTPSSGAPDSPFWRLLGEATGDAGACAASATARVATGGDEEMLEQVRSEDAQDGLGLPGNHPGSVVIRRKPVYSTSLW
jgi:hypothetical protein